MEQEKNNRDHNIRTLSDEKSNQDELINKLKKEKKDMKENAAKSSKLQSDIMATQAYQAHNLKTPLKIKLSNLAQYLVGEWKHKVDFPFHGS